MNINRSIFQSIAVPAFATGFLLMIPLIAMHFTDEVAWTLSDFIIAGTFLFGTGLTYKLLTRKESDISYRVAVGFALFTGLFLLWVNGAVGIIGSENNPVNLLYFGVIAVGIIGAIISRFESHGMTYTMVAMAITQAVIVAIALIGGYYESPPSSVFEIVSVNGFFIVLFIVSAMLFRFTVSSHEN